VATCRRLLGAGRRARRERGSMAVEVTLLAPLMVGFMLLVVAFGRYVAVKGQVEAASRDAVRAASLERTEGAAAAAATAAAEAQLKGRADCSQSDLGGNFAAGGVITVTLRCRVSYSGLGLIGLPGSVIVESVSAAPIDVYRRTA
jgi:Flp pilus assembly protein TadG